MKIIRRILVVVAILIFNFSNAQNILENVEPSTVCPGQCTNVHFRFNPKCTTPGHPSNPSYQPMIFGINGTDTTGQPLGSSYTYSYSQFYNNPKTISPMGAGLQNDTLYTIQICFELPKWKNAYGTFTITATGYCSTAFLGGDKKLLVNFIDCAHVGIEEQQLNNLPIYYYDLYGNLIQPRLNEIIIKQQGRKRTKIIIQ